MTTLGGATDFARLILACESFGPYCLIGGLAVNCYVEPVYTLDADIVVVAASLPDLIGRLGELGFQTEVHTHSVNALAPGSQLRIQFTTDERYQAFPAVPSRARCWNPREDRLPGGCHSGKAVGLWRSARRLSKRKKDELDLIRLAEAYPALKSLYPVELRAQLDRG